MLSEFSSVQHLTGSNQTSSTVPWSRRVNSAL